MPRWTILIATLSRRRAEFSRLLTGLLPQVDAVGGQVTVEALWNHGERPIAVLRQALLEHATAEYVSFVDDDDVVAPDYVARILPLLDGVDYVGFLVDVPFAGRVACHSLRFDSWSDDPQGIYRDISHLNPVRRELAIQGKFTADAAALSWAEDQVWAAQMRPVLHSEHFVDNVMYHYLAEGRSRPEISSVGELRAVKRSVRRPPVSDPWFGWHPGSSREPIGRT